MKIHISDIGNKLLIEELEDEFRKLLGVVKHE